MITLVSIYMLGLQSFWANDNVSADLREAQSLKLHVFNSYYSLLTSDRKLVFVIYFSNAI